MTATMPSRTDTRYRGAVYGIDVLDHDSSALVPDDYVGKTRQRGRQRELQHRDRQPFADRIVGDAHVLWEGMCTEAELDEMERRFIRNPPSGCRPRLNVEMNEDNPHRIPKWKQIEQRHERDDAAHRARWVPFERRTRSSLLEWDAAPAGVSAKPAAAGRPARRKWTSGQVEGALLAAVWLLLTLIGWISVLHWHVWDLGWKQAGGGSAVLALAVVVWVWLDCPVTKRQRRRAWRKLFGKKTRR